MNTILYDYVCDELQEVEKDDDGYYILNTGNGYCWFVTVD